MAGVRIGVATFVLGLVFVGAATASVRELTVEDRIAAQRAIDQVYWNHRIWPQANSRPKPKLDEVLPVDLLRARVERAMKLSEALEEVWGRPVSGAQLQAEMARMAATTRAPEVLREIFSALGNDPQLIAETLARAALVERLAARAFASDPRIHAASLEVATREAAMATEGATDLPTGQQRDVRWVKVAGDVEPGEDPGRLEPVERSLVVPIPEDEWNEQVARAGTLIEREDRFEFVRILSRSEREIVARAVSWPKLGFDAWWAANGRSFEGHVATAPPPGGYSLPEIGRPAVTTCHAEGWQPTLTDIPSARRDAASVWTGAEMIVWGGYSWKFENTGGRYDPATDTWTATAITPATPSRRFDAMAVWTGTEVIVWGGWSGQAALSTGGRYNPSTDGWTATAVGAGTPVGRARGRAVWTGTEMIVWGGHDAATNTYMNTGGRYSPSSDSWTATSTGAGVPTIRREHTAVWTGSVMIVWGGYNGTAYLNTGSRYNPSTNTWSATVTSATATARNLHTAVWNGTVMIVWGGYNGTSVLNTGSRYNPASNTWTATATTAGVPAAAQDHTAVWTGTEMIVWGGYNGASTVNAGGRYNATTNAWTPTSTATAPEARRIHTAVWTGTEMIVWGGNSVGSNVLATGGRYNPGTDLWTATSMGSGVPLARYRHTAIWSGAEMIVWGGQGLGANVYLDTGGRYDPATNVWTAMPTSGAPTGRLLHTAVWTGTEMIVWGGNGNLQLDDGGRFNPTTGTWAPMAASTGVVSARGFHTAVWTGAEMIVWGGGDAFATFYTNTGGRYDPAGDVWTATSTGPGVPAPRISHTAIWNGTEMIVWGGNDASTAFAAGGRYHASTNTWTGVASAGEPAGRRNHTAVWTGTRMIVWGGDAGGATLYDTGGLYDPGTDSWTATAVAGAPLPRNGHCAVWTGTEMIVWGGSVALYDTGGRYAPGANSWVATTTQEAPPGRRFHTAVWTGSAMIVFGGYDTDATNTGGRYELDTNGQACDDGDSCTGADTCSGLTCVGQALVVPAEVTGLAARDDAETWEWNPATAGPGTVHDVLAGSFLPVGSGAEACVAPGIAVAQTTDATVPLSGGVRWYLVRARNTCGNGTYGSTSGGAPRLSGACP